ncbi:Rap1a/Tai family immunity protein [Massilia sp. W12]|uniref:Rap1a/Tai family immunity protein n=1 Tax=Massilia sp. W12 TaxID=3126507 RepID=UPI0030CD9C72
MIGKVFITLFGLALLGMLQVVAADSKLLKSEKHPQSMIIENNNLIASEFFAAYMSKNMQERRFAEMYLLGVLDATEGSAWCDYKLVKTISLDEMVYEGFKNSDPEKLKRRASSVISEILQKKLACKKGRK